jgi:hypothetical protein
MKTGLSALCKYIWSLRYPVIVKELKLFSTCIAQVLCYTLIKHERYFCVPKHFYNDLVYMKAFRLTQYNCRTQLFFS